MDSDTLESWLEKKKQSAKENGLMPDKEEPGTFEELAADTLAQVREDEASRIIKKAARKEARIKKQDELIQKFIAGATEGRTWLKHGVSSLQIHRDTIYWVQGATYSPICKRLQHNLFLFNSDRHSDLESIEDRLNAKISDLEEYRIIWLTMSVSHNAPRGFVRYERLDSEVGDLLRTLDGINRKIAALERDPDYNIPDTLDELRYDKQRAGNYISALRGLVRRQVRQEQKEALNKLWGDANWLRKNLAPDIKVNERSVNSIISTRQQVQEFLESVDKYLDILKSMPRSGDEKEKELVEE